MCRYYMEIKITKIYGGLRGNDRPRPKEKPRLEGYPRMEISLKLRTTRPPEVKRPKLICGRKREEQHQISLAAN